MPSYFELWPKQNRDIVGAKPLKVGISPFAKYLGRRHPEQKSPEMRALARHRHKSAGSQRLWTVRSYPKRSFRVGGGRAAFKTSRTTGGRLCPPLLEIRSVEREGSHRSRSFLGQPRLAPALRLARHLLKEYVLFGVGSECRSTPQVFESIEVDGVKIRSRSTMRRVRRPARLLWARAGCQGRLGRRGWANL
jgi:hypothetical protein